MIRRCAIFGKAFMLALLIAVYLLASSGLSAHAQTRMRAVAATQMKTWCAGNAVPLGWIVYNAIQDPTQCGNSYITYNMEYIESYYDQPLYALLSVCASEPTPDGWSTVAGSQQHDGGRCGDGTYVNLNIEMIERISIGTPSIDTNGVVNSTDYSPNDIHPDSTVSIFGFNFNAPDQVIVMQAGTSVAIQSGSPWWFDGNPASAQINATLPPSITTGSAVVYVKNANGLQSIGQPITIRREP